MVGPTNAHEQARPRAWWLASVLCLLAILSYTDRQILNLLVDPIRADLALSDSLFSYTQGAAFAVIYAVFGIPAGMLADRICRRNLIFAGALFWSAGTAACGLSHSFAELFGARVIVGVGEAVLAPAGLSLLANSFAAPSRGAPIGIFIMGMTLGPGVAVMFSGYMLQAFDNGLAVGLPFFDSLAPWRRVLLTSGALGLPVLLLLLTVREPVREGMQADGQAAKAPGFFDQVRERRLLLVPLYLGMALLSVADYATYAWLPALLLRGFGLDSSAVATMFGATAIAVGVGGALAGGIAADAVHRVSSVHGIKMLALGTLAAPILAAYALAPSAPAAIVGAGGYLFLSGAVATAAVATIQGLFSGQVRGMATSVNAFCNILLGLGLGPTLVALLNEAGGRPDGAPRTALAAVSATAALMAFACFAAAARTASQAPHIAKAHV